MNLNELRDALLTVGVPVFHYVAHKQTGNYIVWAEDGEAGSGHGDNHKTIQVITGTVDYFTKIENDLNFKAIQEALNGIDIAWELNSIQHEDDTGYIHYEWVWEMII